MADTAAWTPGAGTNAGRHPMVSAATSRRAPDRSVGHGLLVSPRQPLPTRPVRQSRSTTL